MLLDEERGILAVSCGSIPTPSSVLTVSVRADFLHFKILVNRIFLNVFPKSGFCVRLINLLPRQLVRKIFDCVCGDNKGGVNTYRLTADDLHKVEAILENKDYTLSLKKDEGVEHPIIPPVESKRMTREELDKMKSVKIKMLSAILLPTDGSITIEGMDMSFYTPAVKGLRNKFLMGKPIDKWMKKKKE